jgi:hypothetical protein
MKSKMNNAEYGAYIREQSKKYWLRYKAKETLRNQKLAAAKIVITEAEIVAEMAKQAKK